MLYTKFQWSRPFGSAEEDFYMFLPYMGMAAILVMWPGPFEQTFVAPSHRSFIWNLTLIGPVVSEEMFKDCGRRRTYPISSPMSLRLRWAKKLTFSNKNKMCAELKSRRVLLHKAYCSATWKCNSKRSRYRTINLPAWFEPHNEKTCFCHMRTTKTQISLHIRAVW